MANTANTDYKVRLSREAAANLWGKLQELKVNYQSVWLGDLAKAYDIDYEAKGISVRGHIYWADFEEDIETGDCLISFSTESAWTSCSEFFEELNKTFGYALSISHREIECGCDIYYVHDEWDFFPEECSVSANGEPFDNIYDEPFDTIAEAINLWCSLTGIAQGDRNEDEMIEYINGYDYDEDDTYFYIHPFTLI